MVCKKSSIHGVAKMLKRIVFLLAFVIPSMSWADSQLFMAEEKGCYWCAKWHEEIAHIYPKSPEGHAAPLVRYDLNNEIPDVAFAKSVHFTPTFILVKNGVEVGRIEGYPGEDFFWGLLAMMIRDAGIPLENES